MMSKMLILTGLMAALSGCIYFTPRGTVIPYLTDARYCWVSPTNKLCDGRKAKLELCACAIQLDDDRTEARNKEEAIWQVHCPYEQGRLVVHRGGLNASSLQTDELEAELRRLPSSRLSRRF